MRIDSEVDGLWLPCLFCEGTIETKLRKLGEETPKIVLCEKCFTEWNEMFQQETTA